MDPRIQVKLDNIISAKIIFHKHQCFQSRATQDQKLIQIHTVDKYGGIYNESTKLIDAVNILPLARFEPMTLTTPPSTTPDIDATNCSTETSKKRGCSSSADIDDDQCSTRHILVLFQCMASISFTSESLMDPRIQVK